MCNNNNRKLVTAIQLLDKYCKSEDYKGYSLYDSHNSPIPFAKLGTKLSFLINQVNKRSLINIRPLLGIKKGINPKGYGLFLHAYSILASSEFFDYEEAEKKAHFFFKWLIENPSQGYSRHCWGYNYYWPKKKGDDTPAYTPSVVVTGFVSRALLTYYENFNSNQAKDILKSCASFVIKDIPLYKGDNGYCFSYTPIKKDLTINANLLAAEILAYSDYVNSENKYSKYIEEVIKFTLEKQNKDGSWFYAFDYNTSKPKKQIDFHQGYVLESLFKLTKYSKKEYPLLKQSIKKGLKFYFNQQFSTDGFAFWRIPKKHPVDIHNQSQGIITFSTFCDFDERYLPFALTIADWTIKNMQNKNGAYYYQKWPLITNKISYMRWNNAWMMVALTILLSKLK